MEEATQNRVAFFVCKKLQSRKEIKMGKQ